MKAIKQTAKAKKTLEGKIVSAKNPKTVIVAVTHLVKHPLYQKAIKRTHRFAAHVETLVLAVGDRVHIAETKPISKTKHFIVTEKL